jgi:beta-lactamase class A
MVFKTEQEIIPEVKPLLKGKSSVDGEKQKRTRKKQPPKGSRWSIAIFFALTLILIGLFWLKTSLPVFWQEITAPLVITSSRQTAKLDSDPVLKQIQSLTQELQGEYGLYVYEISSKKEYGFSQKETFPAASLMKLPVMLCFYQEVEKGNLSLETKYTLVEKDKVSGAGILQGKTAGSIYSYLQLIEYMGQYSDNTAFKVLRRVLGDEKIQQTIDDLGMSGTSLADFETTPEDIGLLFQKLYQGKTINTGHRDQMLGFLTKTVFEDWLPAGLPKEIRMAHKIGKDLGTFADGGIVFTDQPYVIVVMSKEAREEEAKEVLPEISRRVFDFESSVSSL